MSVRWLSRAAVWLLPLLLLGGCATVTPGPEKPRLVVLLVVDGLPQRQVTAYRDQLAPDGLARFLDRGAWYAEAHYTHAVTATAPGHATLLTGATPSRTGIVGNGWRDLATGAEVYNTGDTAHRYIGHATRPLDGTSPRNLRAETVGDVLRRGDPRAKVIAISGKDRGAILPAGQLGTAYMYMGSSGQFASTTYYMPGHPAWVDAFHAGKPADRWFRSQWQPLLPDAAYARSVPDGQPWFNPRGAGLPMRMAAPDAAAPNAAYYAALLRSPFADQLALDFGLAAVRGEQLGQDEVPDILSISLSGHDYVNHAFSAESRLSHDHVLQLDRMLQAFFRELDATVGRDRYLAVLSADHGFTPAPEHGRAQGRDAGRLDFGATLARVNAELAQSFGATPLVRSSPASSLVVDRRLVAQHGLDLQRVAEVARESLLRDPGIAAAYTRRELERGSLPDAPFFAAMRRSWHPEVSGEVQYVYKRDWIATSNSATHGSPYRDDTHVPMLLWGPRWVRAGRVDTPVAVVDFAPTLARVLGLPAPAASEGKPLP